jgi:hypothetical protein
MLTSKSRARLVTSLALASTALAGCAHQAPAQAELGSKAEWGKITPARSPDSAVTREEAYYQGAVTAIVNRDYAGALDLLQAARAARPDDVRVLNAFGVVYDKLGRFDLSARYYAQASALSPNSPVIMANEAYSAELQHLQVVGAPPQMAKLAPPPAAAPAPVMPAKVTLAPPAAPSLWEESFVAAKAEPVQSASPQAAPVVTSMIPEIQHASLPLANRAAATPTTLSLTQPSPLVAAEERLAAAPQPEPVRVVASAPEMAQHAKAPSATHATRISARTAFLPSPEAPLWEKPAPAAAAPPPTMLVAVAQPLLAAPWEDKVIAAGPARILLASNPAPAPKPAPHSGLTPVRPALQRLAVAHPDTRFRSAGGLRIVNATGVMRAAEPLRFSLASLGWTAPRSAVVPAVTRTRTTIYYHPSRAATARALANTLPGVTRLSACLCRGIQLVLGADSANWRKLSTSHANARAGA